MPLDSFDFYYHITKQETAWRKDEKHKGMAIKYLEEHKACYNYEKEKECLVEELVGQGPVLESILLNNHSLFYVYQGEVKFSYATYSDVLVKEGELFFVPIGSELTYEADHSFKCMMFRLEDEIRFCDSFRITMLRELAGTLKKESPCILKANPPIHSCAMTVLFFLSQEMRCRSLLDYKRKELLYLFRGFYTKKELTLFFYEGINENTSFSCGVIRNYRRYSSVKELAESLNYTVSGFTKRFKKTFGVSPAKWLREQKSKEIYRDVCLCKLNFKEIADKFDFSSTSTFNDFYKVTFGETPGTTRKKQS